MTLIKAPVFDIVDHLQPGEPKTGETAAQPEVAGSLPVEEPRDSGGHFTPVCSEQPQFPPPPELPAELPAQGTEPDQAPLAFVSAARRSGEQPSNIPEQEHSAWGSLRKYLKG